MQVNNWCQNKPNAFKSIQQNSAPRNAKVTTFSHQKLLDMWSRRKVGPMTRTKSVNRKRSKEEMMELTEEDVSKSAVNYLNVLKDLKDDMNVWGNGRLEIKIPPGMCDRLGATWEQRTWGCIKRASPKYSTERREENSEQSLRALWEDTSGLACVWCEPGEGCVCVKNTCINHGSKFSIFDENQNRPKEVHKYRPG